MTQKIRSLMVELAWLWLRYQPDSALSKWYHERCGTTSRNKRIYIVALARKLLVGLWRYLDQGVLPECALLKDAA